MFYINASDKTENPPVSQDFPFCCFYSSSCLLALYVALIVPVAVSWPLQLSLSTVNHSFNVPLNNVFYFIFIFRYIINF